MTAVPALPGMVAAVSVSRGARPPASILIDAEHVAVTARSERYARAEGSGKADLFTPLSRFWRRSWRVADAPAGPSRFGVAAA